MTTLATPPATADLSAASVKSIAASVARLTTLPEVVRKVLELIDNPRTTPQELHKVISHDPALSSRILKVVNSAFYGLPGQIGSIDRAIVMLGHQALVNTVLAASMAKLFRGPAGNACIRMKDLWRHSVAVGALSKLIAGHISPALREEAFLAGLVHDLGILVQLQALREPLAAVVQQATGDGARYTESESRLTGSDHQALGAALVAQWNFPRPLGYVTAYHHRPLALARDCRFLTSLVHVADQVCCQQGLGYSLTCHGEPMAWEVLPELGFSKESLDTWTAALPALLEQAESLLG